MSDQAAYQVTATWDDEAAVWVATSADIPGLVTEADTLEDLRAALRELVPVLLEENAGLIGRSFDQFEMTVREPVQQHGVA